MTTYTAGDAKYWRDRYYTSQESYTALMHEAEQKVGTALLQLDDVKRKLRNLRAVCVGVFLLFAGLALVAAHRMGQI